MVKNIILIDYENVKPKTEEMELLKGPQFEVIVFFGPGNSGYDVKGQLFSSRVPLRIEWTTRQGPNALDMLIAYQLGQLVPQFPKAFFHIISKDGDYDSLVDYLRGKGIKAGKSTSIGELPCVVRPPVKEKQPKKEASPTEAKMVKEPSASVKAAGAKAAPAAPLNEKARMEKVIESLIKRGESRPKSRKGLRGIMKNLFQNTLSEAEIDKLVQGLSSRQIVKIKGEKVLSYTFPSPSVPMAKAVPGQKVKVEEVEA